MTDRQYSPTAYSTWLGLRLGLGLGLGLGLDGILDLCFDEGEAWHERQAEARPAAACIADSGEWQVVSGEW